MAGELYINMANDLTAKKYTSAGVLASNNYAVIQVDWANLNGYPELVVETSTDNEDYYPANMIDALGLESPIKLRMIDTDGNNSLTIDSVYGSTPYVRVVVYGGNCTSGLIAYKIDVG